MQTNLAAFIKDTPRGRAAEEILRNCVHCGFCTATCPTYQLLGDELDGPRGRIYLIKQMLEGTPVSAKTRRHLDRCLTCRACETTCPSGVRYARLADIGREVVEEQVPRSGAERLLRWLLRAVLAHPARFTPLMRVGQSVRGLLPPPLRSAVPARRDPGEWAPPRHARQAIALDGCVQPAIAPHFNAAASRVLDRLGISLVRIGGSGCCGAVSHHLSAPAEGLDFMRRNIDAWWPALEAGAESIVITASACASMVKEYAELLSHDPTYADKAARVSSVTRDLAEVIADESLELTEVPRVRVAFHSPCTLQHAQKLDGMVESILRQCGFELTAVPEPHLCCGSAGTYSILQRSLSLRLLERKLSALSSGAPDVIATANIGCYMHLMSRSTVPVRHWIELLDD